MLLQNPKSGRRSTNLGSFASSAPDRVRQTAAPRAPLIGEEGQRGSASEIVGSFMKSCFALVTRVYSA